MGRTDAAAAGIAALAVMLPQSAEAQTSSAVKPSGGIALNRYEPAPVGDFFFGVSSPSIQGKLVPRLSFTLDYARKPLVLGRDASEVVLIERQVFAHLGASLAIENRLLLETALPMALVQEGGDPQEYQHLRGDLFFRLPDGPITEAPMIRPALGDIQVGLRLRFLGQDEDALQAAIALRAHFPTGQSGLFSEGKLVGQGALRITPQVLLGGRGDHFVWSTSLGFVVSAPDDTAARPPSLQLGIGAGLILGEDRLQLGPELLTSMPLHESYTVAASGMMISHGEDAGAELLLGARLRLGSVVLGTAAGGGVSHAMGTPSYRVLGSMAISPPAERRGTPSLQALDTDHDGIPDSEDACPYTFGYAHSDPKRNGCPREREEVRKICTRQDLAVDSDECVTDSDGDKVIDSLDQCPEQPGRSEYYGCVSLPAVNIDYGTRPQMEEVPQPQPPPTGTNSVPSNVPPVASGQKDVAPIDTDTDHDGFRDPIDACPRERGGEGVSPETRGCPALVRVSGREIVLLEPVEFRLRQNQIIGITEASEVLLKQVQDVISQHPEFTKIEVQGHTDEAGSASYNEWLSMQRAEAVRAWLWANGVHAKVLTAKGYGSTKPIANNATLEGRGRNRRIQLVVTEVSQ